MATARVVPNIPTFAVDGGFRYSIPDNLSGAVRLGSIVRVPLSGRKVRGWVVETSQSDDEGLKDVASVSGAAPVFDPGLLQTLRWAAQHYVAPLSVLLGRATPPNLPKSSGFPAEGPEVPSGQHPLHELAAQAAEGKKQPSQIIVGSWTDLEWISALAPVVNAGRSVIVVAATVAEVEQIAKHAAPLYGEALVEIGGGSDAQLTRAWEQMQTPGRLIIGTPRLAEWSVGGLAMAVVLEEGRRAMKDRQTPTLHVRDLLRTRSLIEGFTTVFFGPTPSVEVLAAGADVTRVGNRAWPLVEIVDRSGDPPGSGFLSERVVAALRATSDQDQTSFVFTHRRLGLASMRCTKCRTVRQCQRCGTRAGREDQCRTCSSRIGPCVSCGGTEFEEMGTIPERLVSEINRRIGGAPAGVFASGKSIQVGTERDLAGLPPTYLTVAADVDGMLMSHGYRTSEEALRQLARVANSLERGSGHRMMVQTSHPESELITTLRRGDPIPYLEVVLGQRAKEGAPPSTEMIAVEVRDAEAEDLAGLLDGGSAFDVLGPIETDGGVQWLLQGDLTSARAQLREVVGRWREAGATVRVDADPIDL